MSKVAITGNASGTGTLTIAAPNTNSDYTLTLPAEAGTVLTSGGAIDVNASAPADSLAIDASGNVGIGTSSPAVELHVQGVSPKFRIQDTEDGVLAFPHIEFHNASGEIGRIGYLSTSNNDLDIYQAVSANIDFWTDATTRMRITSAGNVGIGTSSPAQKLDVNGVIAVGGLSTDQIIAVHTASTTTSYTRTATTDAAFGASLTITPVSASSRFLVFARMGATVGQTGGDNDARAYLDACVRNSDGSYTSFAATNDTNLGVLNGGTDVAGYGDILAIFDTNERYLSNLNIRHYGSCVADATSGQITTLTANYLQVIAVEYL